MHRPWLHASAAQYTTSNKKALQYAGQAVEKQLLLNPYV